MSDSDLRAKIASDLGMSEQALANRTTPELLVQHQRHILHKQGLGIDDRASLSNTLAVGDGVADDTIYIQTLVDLNVGKTCVIPDGTYKITSAITLPSNTYLLGSLNTIITRSTSGTIFDINTKTDIIIDSIKFEGGNNVDAITCTASRNIIVKNCSGNTCLFKNGVSVTYTNVTPSLRSSNIIIKDNNMVGTDKTVANSWCIGLMYADNWQVTDNYIEKYYHGIMWWGGDSDFSANGALANERKCSYGVTKGNIVKDILQGGIWGSMGQYLSIGPDAVSNCGDVGIDLEGCFDSNVYVGTVIDCTNGGLATFFGCKNVRFSGGTVKSTSSAYILARLVSNSSLDASLTGTIVYDGINFECNSGLGSIHTAGPAYSLVFKNNTITNGTLSLATGNNRYVEISSNNFLLTQNPGSSFNVINVEAATYDARIYIKNNQITNTFTPSASSKGIRIDANDFNSSPFYFIKDNEIIGTWTSSTGIEVRWSGANGGISSYFHIKNNIIPSGAKVDTGAQAMTIYQSDNVTATNGAITF